MWPCIPTAVPQFPIGVNMESMLAQGQTFHKAIDEDTSVRARLHKEDTATYAIIFWTRRCEFNHSQFRLEGFVNGSCLGCGGGCWGCGCSSCYWPPPSVDWSHPGLTSAVPGVGSSAAKCDTTSVGLCGSMVRQSPARAEH